MRSVCGSGGSLSQPLLPSMPNRVTSGNSRGATFDFGIIRNEKRACYSLHNTGKLKLVSETLQITEIKGLERVNSLLYGTQ